MCSRGRPRGQGRPRGLHLWQLALLNRTLIFQYADALCNFLVPSATFFFREKFSDACHVNRGCKYYKHNYTLRYMKTTSRILQFFCYDYFEDLLAPITFAKNFQLSKWCIVSKIFAIENALQSKNQFLRNAFGKSYLLRSLTIAIAHKNLILEWDTCTMHRRVARIWKRGRLF